MLTDEQLSELESLPVAEDKEKNIDDLMALPVASENDGTEIEIPDNNFGGPEFLERSAREGLTGFLFSDLPASASKALGATLYDYMTKKDYAGGEKFLADFQEYLKGDQLRQKEFVKKYPNLSMVAEVLGGLHPASMGARLVEGSIAKGASAVFPELATKAAESLPKVISKSLGQAAVTGAGVGVLSKASDQLTEALAGTPTTLQKQAEELATSAAIGAVSAPILGAGLTAGVLGLEKAGNVVGKGVKKALQSKPALMLLQTLTGPRVESQRNYMKFIKEIEALPDESTIVEFFDNVKSRLSNLESIDQKEIENIQNNINNLKQQIEIHNTTIEDQKSKRALNLQTAEKELILIEEKLKTQQKESKKQLKTQEAEIAGETNKPDVSMAQDTLQQALRDTKNVLIEKSNEARALIDPKYRIKKDIFIKAAKDARKEIGLPGTEGAPASAEQERAQKEVDDYIRLLKNENIPTFINGDLVKKLLQGLDSYIDPPDPGAFSEPGKRAFAAMRNRVDTLFKLANEDYKQAMIPVADLAQFLDDASKTFKKKPQNIYEEALNNQVLRDKLLRLQQYTDQDVLEPLELLQNYKQETSKLAKLQASRQLPGYKAIDDASQLLQLASMQDFEKAALENIEDKNVAQQIIALRRNIKAFTEPNRFENDLQSKVLMGEMSIDEAKKILDKLQQKQEQFKKQFGRFLGNEKSENLISSILKNVNSPVETENAAKFIRSVTELPDEQFSDLMRTIGLTNPKEFEKMAEHLRMKSVFDRSFYNGSRRVGIVNGIITGISTLLGGIGYSTGGAWTGVGTAAGSSIALSALLGGMLDDFGPKLTKDYLKNISQLNGLPTLSKIERFTPMPLTNRLRNAFTNQLTTMATDIDPKKWFYVSNDQIPELESDLKTSKLSPLEKAKVLKQLYATNYVDGKTIRTLLLSNSDSPSKEKQLFERVFQPEKRDDLNIDNPKILKALEQGA